VRNYVKRHPRLAEVIEEAVELNLDTAESQLMTLIANGNLGAVIFYLKTKGKARGYVERVEATGSGGGPIKIDIETVRNARQRNLELVEEVSRRLASRAAGVPPAQQAKILSRMSPKEAVNFPYAWRDWWARPAQLAPPGEWSTWLVMAGRFFGKTRTGAQWIHERVKSGIARFVALVAPTAADARDVDGARAGRHPRDRPAGMEANLPAVSATADLAQWHDRDAV